MELENNKDTSVINLIALIPRKDWENAANSKDKLIKRFGMVDIENLDPDQETWREVEYEVVDSTRYKVKNAEGNWLLFADSYHPLWKYTGGGPNLSAFSMINAFYLESESGELYFGGQDVIRSGYYITLGTIALLLLAVLLRK